MDDDKTREQLCQLGAEQLADTLLELAKDNVTVQDTVLRMTAARSESITRYKAKLKKLAQTDRFISWKDVPMFCEELEQMLLDLQAGVEDADAGFDLITEFFEADKDIFEQCDDSSGAVGAVFHDVATDLLAQYGAGCNDPSRVVARLIALYGDDEYGIRDVVINAAHRFLPEPFLRILAEQLWERARHEDNESYAARHWFIGLSSIALQLRDAPLFEQVQRAMHVELPVSAYSEIASAYLDAGDAATARAWLERIPEQSHLASMHDALLLKVLQQLGDTDAAAQVAWRIFEGYHSEDTLQSLLKVIGEEQRVSVIEQTATAILRAGKFSSSDATFLMCSGRVEDAATYILAHAAHLNGDAYYSLLPLAECMEEDSRWLAATVIYRALIESTLQRKVSKYYHHGVRYLCKLDVIATKITDWQGYGNHTEFLQRLRAVHGRKSSFWAQYSG